jgi:hypothetical protein
MIRIESVNDHKGDLRMFKHKGTPIVLLLTASCLLVGIAVAGPRTHSRPESQPLRLDEATVIVEVNATEGDAGIQFFLDGEPWRSMSVSGPAGQEIGKLLGINTKGRLRGHGLTELFIESSEPPFDELPLRKFKKLFPEGRYSFEGETIEGRRLVGRARLSHDIPNGPDIISPEEGATVDPDNAVASWAPGPQPADVDIVAYRAIVEREDPLRVFSVDLPASVTSVTIPSEFLESGTEYLFELQAIEASGNITFSEVHFMVQ